MPLEEVRSARLRERGPRLVIRVGVSEAVERAWVRSGQPTRSPLPVEALIDTGSGRSLLETGLAEELKLDPVGRVEVDTPSSKDLPAFEYLVRFWIGVGAPIEVRALGAPLPVPGLRALLGRDVLACARLVYDGPADRFSIEY